MDNFILNYNNKFSSDMSFFTHETVTTYIFVTKLKFQLVNSIKNNSVDEQI